MSDNLAPTWQRLSSRAYAFWMTRGESVWMVEETPGRLYSWAVFRQQGRADPELVGGTGTRAAAQSLAERDADQREGDPA
jgi:hypothetical protein